MGEKKIAKIFKVKVRWIKMKNIAVVFIIDDHFVVVVAKLNVLSICVCVCVCLCAVCCVVFKKMFQKVVDLSLMMC